MEIKSWKTTVLGILGLIGLTYETYSSGFFDANKFMFLITSLGLLLAKDSDVTNSDSGDDSKSNAAARGRGRVDIEGDLKTLALNRFGSEIFYGDIESITIKS